MNPSTDATSTPVSRSARLEADLIAVEDCYLELLRRFPGSKSVVRFAPPTEDEKS